MLADGISEFPTALDFGHTYILVHKDRRHTYQACLYYNYVAITHAFIQTLESHFTHKQVAYMIVTVL